MYLYLLIVVLIILIFWVYQYDTISIGTRNWYVLRKYPDSHKAAELLSRLHSTMINFMRKLKHKYKIDKPGEIGANTRSRLMVDYLLDNYNPDTFYENDPQFSTETSYTVNKGDRMYLCLRSKTPPYTLVSYDIMIFVLLHEMAHIANYDGWNHGDDYWAAFKFILHEAVLAGIYTPVDYGKYPVHYCGMLIEYQPLYDTSLPNLWE
jgi:hypothetical protein